ILDGVVEGTFPRRALRHVLEWYELHRGELLEDWQLCERNENPLPIEPFGIVMLIHLTDAQYVGGYRIQVTFSNGRTGIADLREPLSGPAFEGLKDESEFRQFMIDDELDTIVWANGADLAPEYVYFQAFRDDPGLEQQFKDWGYIN